MYFIILVLYFIATIKSTKIEDIKRMLSSKESVEWINSMAFKPERHSSYCNFCCINILSETIGKNCGSHTLCKYKENATGPLCRGYVPISFTSSEKAVILDAHNTLRNHVAQGGELRGSPGPQPKAANMRKLEWNQELAEVAERWAAQCIYNHDECRDLERFPVGQNIAQGNLATNSELDFIRVWYDQVTRFNGLEVSGFRLRYSRRHAAAKYTQMVWADTYQIGCARAVFQNIKGPLFSYREHFFCNYGPTGNIPNQRVYLIGSPCSMCPEGTTCSQDYSGLCQGEATANIEEDFFHEYKYKNVRSNGVSNRLYFLYLLVFYVQYI